MGSHQGNRKIFAYILIAVQIFVVIMYGLFLRPLVHNDDAVNVAYYPMYQDVNVMMLIGFGFLMTFIKSHAWSALSYTFFINAIIVQLYLLLAPFWSRVFHGGWDDRTMNIVQMNFTGASYCVASVLIAFGAVLGRVGALQLLLMGLVQIVGYTLNEYICYELLHIQDVGGSTVIHTFGAYFGLTVSLVLSRSVFPKTKPESSYSSNIFAMIGTLFLWMFWPSFNAGFFPHNGYQKTVIVSNTIIALTGSCLSTFIMSALLRNKFSMQDILNATLAGGVMIGAGAGLFVNPAAALCIGLFAGTVSVFGYYYLTAKLQHAIGLQDTCGVHNLHGMPGFLGGIFSAIAVSAYASDPLGNATQTGLLIFYSSPYGDRTFYQQGGFQIAGTVVSLAMGIAFGFVAGLIMKQFYVFEPNEFYKDGSYFQLSQQHGEQVQLNDTLDNNIKIVGGSNQKLKHLPPLKGHNNTVDNNSTM